MAPKEVYLVIGGSGFVGRHIVQQLLDRGDTVVSLDIVQRYHDVPFFSVDITDEEQVADALRKSGATCIIHTASPPATINNPALFFKVNVDGTKAIIAAAVAAGVRKLVYTSSAGVVFNGGDLINVDERLAPPEVPLDAYNDSKAKAEAIVLAANGKDGLSTVAIRPAGIFGPGDRQVMSGLYTVYENNQTHFQIGDNTNMFDWTYVGNVARAHILAADNPLQVAGQAFFVTNGEPCYFWDFPRLVWHHLDSVFPGKRQPRKPLKLSKPIGLLAATGAEYAAWLMGKEPTFTRFKVSYSCVNRWYNIEKARRVLGYEPIIGLEEGIKLMVEWWAKEYAAGSHKTAH
ncbi:Sterol-4-alpha-carboxylate 3-dehydrogenase, decarboxylating [Termitomyces sp. J132]|nr:Sterol-4-alpha-carboxylate 3-dehydrogenase, decarboxylating [Termitomyces sp. J132]